MPRGGIGRGMCAAAVRGWPAASAGGAWRRRGDARSGREALSVAQRVMASEEATLRKAVARKSSLLQPASLLEILSERVRRGEWQAALKVFELLRAQQWYEPYTGTYIRLFEMLARCKRPSEAGELYRAMILDGCRPSREALTALMSAYTRSSLLGAALEILDAMKAAPHCSPDVFTYSLLIKACSDAGQLSRAGELLAEMLARGVPPTRVTYNILLAAYAKAGLADELQQLAARMLAGSCKPDHWSRNAVVAGLGSHGHIALMEEWFQRLTAAAGEPPDSLTLHSLMSAYAKAQLLDKLHAVVRYLHKYHYDVDAVTYNILIDAYGRAGRSKLMLATFASMKCAGVKPDAVTYCTLVNYYAKLGFQRRLPKLLAQMELHKVKPDTALYNAILDAYKRVGDTASVDRYLLQMTDAGCKPDHATYNIVISAYRAGGLADKAHAMAIEKEKLRQHQEISSLFVADTLRESTSNALRRR